MSVQGCITSYFPMYIHTVLHNGPVHTTWPPDQWDLVLISQERHASISCQSLLLAVRGGETWDWIFIPCLSTTFQHCCPLSLVPPPSKLEMESTRKGSKPQSRNCPWHCRTTTERSLEFCSVAPDTNSTDGESACSGTSTSLVTEKLPFLQEWPSISTLFGAH